MEVGGEHCVGVCLSFKPIESFIQLIERLLEAECVKSLFAIRRCGRIVGAQQ